MSESSLVCVPVGVQVLVGYMALSCILLLGLMGGLLWETALIRWELPCDKFTFYFALYNFAAVGVTAIFYQKVPTHVYHRHSALCKSNHAKKRVLKHESSFLPPAD